MPRKGGPGITQSDFLVINKTDLAQAVEADLGVMDRDTRRMRRERPSLFAQVKNRVGMDEVAARVRHAWEHATAGRTDESVQGRRSPKQSSSTPQIAPHPRFHSAATRQARFLLANSPRTAASRI